MRVARHRSDTSSAGVSVSHVNATWHRGMAVSLGSARGKSFNQFKSGSWKKDQASTCAAQPGRVRLAPLYFRSRR